MKLIVAEAQARKMAGAVKWLAAILAVGVLYRHSAHHLLPILPEKAWFYINGGIWEAVLCGLIAAFLLAAKRDKWTKLGITACVIGALEGLQMAACRLAVGNERVGGNLCDAVTGLPIGAVMFSLYMIFICWAIKE